LTGGATVRILDRDDAVIETCHR